MFVHTNLKGKACLTCLMAPGSLTPCVMLFFLSIQVIVWIYFTRSVWIVKMFLLDDEVLMLTPLEPIGSIKSVVSERAS